MEEKIIQLAALLHDVGKFWQGAGGGGKHAELSGRFVQGHVPWEGVVGLVSSHHDPSKYRSEGYKPLKTIVCADWLSSGERRELEDEGEEGNRRETPLKSIFSEIDIGKGKSASAHYYPIKKLELDKDVIFPKPLEGIGGKDRLKSDYTNLWDNFVEEVDGIKGITDFDSYFNTLYYLLQKYTWCVPSAVGIDVPDVSLFDHLKTTCAIVACLCNADEKYLDDLINSLSKRHGIKEGLKKEGFKEDALTEKIEERWEKWVKDAGEEGSEIKKTYEEKKKFLLVGGDISGVQKFIYRLASPEKAQKGMSKRLRGRSFYLSLLTETFAHYILEKLNLPMTNLIWCGGGHFCILAPNTDSVGQNLDEIKRSINNWLLQFFQGDLYLALAKVEASSKEIVDFSDLLDKLNYELSIAKNKKYSELFGEEDIFGPYGQGEKEKFVGVCSVCGMDVAEWGDESVELGTNCAKHGRIGQKLPKTTFFVEITVAKSITDFIIEDMAIPFDEFNIIWYLVKSTGELKSIDLLLIK